MHSETETDNKISYTLKLSDNNSYIIVTVKGTIMRNNAMSFVKAVRILSREKDIRVLLLDITDARNRESIGNNYDFTYYDLSIDPNLNKLKVAMLVAEDDHSHDFIETLAINSGHILRLFRNKKDALEYLLKK